MDWFRFTSNNARAAFVFAWSFVMGRDLKQWIRNVVIAGFVVVGCLLAMRFADSKGKEFLSGEVASFAVPVLGAVLLWTILFLIHLLFFAPYEAWRASKLEGEDLSKQLSVVAAGQAGNFRLSDEVQQLKRTIAIVSQPAIASYIDGLGARKFLTDVSQAASKRRAGQTVDLIQFDPKLRTFAKAYSALGLDWSRVMTSAGDARLNAIADVANYIVGPNESGVWETAEHKRDAAAWSAYWMQIAGCVNSDLTYKRRGDLSETQIAELVKFRDEQ